MDYATAKTIAIMSRQECDADGRFGCVVVFRNQSFWAVPSSHTFSGIIYDDGRQEAPVLRIVRPQSARSVLNLFNDELAKLDALSDVL